MSLIIKLKNTTFNNPNLPVLGDYGRLYTDQLKGLYRLEGDATYLDDTSGNDNDLLYSGDAGAATAPPSFSNGIYSLPDPELESLFHAIDTGVNIQGQAFTFVVAYKRLSSRGFYLIRSSDQSGVALFLSNGLQAYFSSAGTIDFGNNVNVGEWNVIVYTVDDVGIRCVVNNEKVGDIKFSDHGGAPAVNSRTYQLGASNISQGFQGELAFSAMYDRAMSDTEMVSASRGIVNFLQSQKSIVI